MDRLWNVLLTNSAAPRFFGRFIDLAAWPAPRNLLHLLFDPAGLRPFIASWEEVARTLIQRVRGEAVGRVLDEALRQLVEELLAYPGTSPRWRASQGSAGASNLPVIPITFVKDGESLSYFSMLTTVAAPQASATQELRIEPMFPTDEDTERRHLRIMS